MAECASRLTEALSSAVELALSEASIRFERESARARERYALRVTHGELTRLEDERLAIATVLETEAPGPLRDSLARQLDVVNGRMSELLGAMGATRQQPQLAAEPTLALEDKTIGRKRKPRSG